MRSVKVAVHMPIFLRSTWGCLLVPCFWRAMRHVVIFGLVAQFFQFSRSVVIARWSIIGMFWSHVTNQPFACFTGFRLPSMVDGRCTMATCIVHALARSNVEKRKIRAAHTTQASAVRRPQAIKNI